MKEVVFRSCFLLAYIKNVDFPTIEMPTHHATEVSSVKRTDVMEEKLQQSKYHPSN